MEENPSLQERPHTSRSN